MPTVTPWGPSQHQTAKGPGIVFHSTAGHGGFHLDRAHMARFRRRFPWFEPFAGAPWFEEDCDAVAVILAFPEHFTPGEVFNAIRAARGMGKASEGGAYNVQWQLMADHIDRTPALLAVEAAEEARTRSLWETGSMSAGCFAGGYGGFWCVAFERGDERQSRMLPKYPEKQWYTDEELAAFERYDPARHNRPRATA